MARPEPAWDPLHLPDQSGRTFLVTGSNAGLGFFACEQLAGAGAHVIMSGRSPNRLLGAREALQRRNPDASVETLLLDTSNLGSVRAAAATVRSRGRLDGLLLNAGIVHPPKERETTGDGHEVVLATNVLGHFALAGEMLTVLASSSDEIDEDETPTSRIVWMGSMSTSMWRYDPIDPELVENYSAWRAYVQSKVIAQALGFEADRRLRAAGVSVASMVAHPGYSTSGRTRGIRGVNEPTRATRFADNLQSAITQSKERGAWSAVRALLDPDASGGDFIGPRFVARGTPRAAKPSKETRDPRLGERVWASCEVATAVAWPFDAAAAASW